MGCDIFISMFLVQSSSEYIGNKGDGPKQKSLLLKRSMLIPTILKISYLPGLIITIVLDFSLTQIDNKFEFFVIISGTFCTLL